MAQINQINDLLFAVLDQDIKQSREQTEQYITYKKMQFQMNPYLADYEKEHLFHCLEKERQQLLSIQDKRELIKKLAELLNEGSKLSENKGKKQ